MTFTTFYSFVTENTKVVASYTYEPDPDLSFDETGETQNRVASGEWGVYLFRIQVFVAGLELGVSHLGNSVYANPSEFRDHIGAQGKWGSYFKDMVREACKEARHALRSMQGIHVKPA